MKKTFTLIAFTLSLALFTGCDTKKTNDTESTAPADQDQAKIQVNTALEKFHADFKSKNTEAIKAVTDENGLFLGTDPEEVFSHQAFINYLSGKLVNPAIGTIEYKIDRREIHFGEDNKTAIVVDQFKPEVFTQNIPWRLTTHLIHKNNKWVFDFVSFTITPSNDVLPAINMAAFKE